MNLKRLMRSKVVWLTAAVLSLMLAAVAIAQAAPTIPSGATPPASHADGRSTDACTDCHTVVTVPTPIVLPVPITIPGQDADDDDATEIEDALEVEDADDADEVDDAHMDADDADEADEVDEADDAHMDADDADDADDAHIDAVETGTHSEESGSESD